MTRHRFMKIALVVHQFLPRHRTGTELYGHHLARAFRTLGHEPRVFCYEEGARPLLGVRDDEEQGVPVRRVFRREQVFAEPLTAEYRSPVVRKMFRDRVTSITALSDDRYTIELPASEPPEKLIYELSLHGVDVVSLNPVRATLEDYFVAAVGEAAPRDTTALRA